MIAYVRGRVDSTGPDSAVVEVGGVGLALLCAPATAAALVPGEEARLATSLVVREDSLTLYGFADADEKLIFELVQTASGVGPKVALAMLAALSPDEIRRAVAVGDARALTRVSGIGPKGAQKIILELKGKLGEPVGGTRGGGVPVPAQRVQPWRDQVAAGLQSLGWGPRDAEAAVDAVAADLDGEQVPPIPELLKAALRKLSRP
ncbi:Holliday junction branch migration protein RuvA [Actinocorallia sp. A-T 12471]|uniref:Holliday junction branch migration protein RuvA n=1 Tax=Actinocorallia sp. A-T 12471 TaxID=3089813 RepID=UPI0029CECEBC|nr:Holliday junction branch migration protein RuvA [Actinocorallia sp. A-T 12471]MDX6740308.1 Holliday junction branch migration protein RuvA [Actinocorallia sp. A-T 12471]